MTPSSRISSTVRWPWLAFVLIAIIAASAALVGLHVTSLGTDELFSLYLVDHQQGLNEVWHRVLTDTWPPLYYFVLYGWTRLAGYSEVAVRLPSVFFAIMALLVFGFGTRNSLSRTARAFAVAVAALSPFWYQHAQNTRGYALGMLLSSMILVSALAVFSQFHERKRLPWVPFVGLAICGLLASFTHAYLLLSFGMVLLYLLLTIPSWQLRAWTVVVGLLVLLANVGYYHVMLAATQQQLGHMWFKSTPEFFRSQSNDALHGLLAIHIRWLVAGLLAAWVFQRALHYQRGPVADIAPSQAGWSTGLAWLVVVGVMLSGITISILVAPSFSDRNLLINAPFAWLLLARLYDVAGPRADTRSGRCWLALVIAIVGVHVLQLKGRLLPHYEPWRQSAQLIRDYYPQCLSQPLPVVFPLQFGPPTPAFYQLAEHDFYGYYLPQASHLLTVFPAEMAGHLPLESFSQVLTRRAGGVDSCPVLAWGMHLLTEDDALTMAEDLANRPELAGHRVLVQELVGYEPRRLGWVKQPQAFLFLLTGPAGSGANPLPPTVPFPTREPRSVIGDRLLVEHLNTMHGTTGPAFELDTYSVQRWPRSGPASEQFVARQRLTCSPPGLRADHAWPLAMDPGCSQRLLPGDQAGKAAGP